MSLDFHSTGIAQLIETFRLAPQRTAGIAVRAINKAIVSGRAEAARRMTTELAFPSGYLGSPNDSRARLRIARKASREELRAVITARVVPTSLARFATHDARGRHVHVRVAAKGGGSFMARAWIVRLRSGASMSEGFNEGLAIRVPKGQSLSGSRAARRLGDNVYLLYAPSVAQAFNLIVEKQDFSQQTAVQVRNEFLRLIHVQGLN